MKQPWSAVALACFAVAALVTPARAQQGFPSRPITYVVPLAAGSTTDVAARLIAQKVTATTGAQIIVENKPGASTMLGSQAVAKAEPDGHTLLMGASSLTVNTLLFKNFMVETERDLTPISLLVTAPLVMVVNPKLEVKTLKEFLAKYKDSKDLAFASSGTGTMLHLGAEVFKIHSGIDLRPVFYRGGGPALTDVIAGHVPLMFATPVAKGNIDKGDVIALAVTGSARHPMLPDVPTFAEAGLPMPEVENGAWFGLLGPANMPKDRVQRLNRDFNQALEDPEVRDNLIKAGLLAKGTTPEQFSAFIKDEIARWPDVFKRAGIQPQ
jgi:tripartite-type tricarboxylate transporter receptor subunit TctC